MNINPTVLVHQPSVNTAWKIAAMLASLLAALSGAYTAAILLPAWLPGLAASMAVSDLTAFWYISRGAAVAAYGLLWLSMVMGLLMTSRLAVSLTGMPAAYDIHQYVSLLGIAFALLHGLVLTGDRYLNFDLLSVFVPFASQVYRPLWVGLGQIALYAWLGLVLSFYVRKRIGQKTWRVIHFAGFAAFLLALVHGVASGTDSGELWTRLMYWSSGGILLFLVVYRVLVRSHLAVGVATK